MRSAMKEYFMKQPVLINQTITKEKARDYLFDNLRAILIILVVWGHLLTSMKDDYEVLKSIYIFIFFFHMPAMTFVSGYFSKNLEKIRSSAFVTVLVPFLILNVLNYVFKILILRDEYYGFRFFRPYWGLWYLLALFLWKFFLKDILRIRFLLPLSFLLALFSGFSREFSDYLALGRTVCFLPFFLLGYYCTPEQVAKIRRIPKLPGVLIILATAALSVYTAVKTEFDLEALYLRGPYPQEAEVTSMLLRLLVYAVAIAMIFAITSLVTAKKTALSHLGASTMTVYILHLFTIPLLEKLELLGEQPYLYLMYSVLMTALITYLYSRPAVKHAYDTAMDWLMGLLLKTIK